MRRSCQPWLVTPSRRPAKANPIANNRRLQTPRRPKAKVKVRQRNLSLSAHLPTIHPAVMRLRVSRMPSSRLRSGSRLPSTKMSAQVPSRSSAALRRHRDSRSLRNLRVDRDLLLDDDKLQDLVSLRDVASGDDLARAGERRRRRLRRRRCGGLRHSRLERCWRRCCGWRRWW